MFVNHEPATDHVALTRPSAETIKATLPLVGSKIDEITPVFYRTMFANHPELLANTFNRGNQHSGEQQKALAASIATFATMLVDPEAPDPRAMLARIGHKHVSLGITRDQYQIVHDNLFAAIVEVLGEDVVTPEVAAAWDEVYWLMAKVLIDFEHDLYASDGVSDGDVFRTAELLSTRPLSDTVVEFTFRSPGFPSALPGQYISLGVTLPDGARQLRQYSLINVDNAHITIAVQRDGEVSSYLMDRLTPGDRVDITLPAGDLVLPRELRDSDLPLVFVSQGIGSTPMVGMLRALADAAPASTRTVLALHADASADAYAQRTATAELIDSLGGRHVTAYRDAGQRLTLSEIEDLPRGAHWFLCGGTSFLQDVRAQLDAADLAPAGVHFELFSPNDWLI